MAAIKSKHWVDMTADEIIKRFNALKSEHSKWTALWSDCARYCAPNCHPFVEATSRTRGAKKRQPIDITGVLCNLTLASYLYSNTVYSKEQWFDLRAEKKQIEGVEVENVELNKCLEKVARQALFKISSSNFDSIYQRFLRNYSSFGTGGFYSEFNDKRELVCRQWEISDLYLAESDKGKIDTVFRSFEYTARQAVQAFGSENVSEEIRKANSDTKECDKRFSFIHAVFPRKKRVMGKKTPDNMPFASVYVEVGEKKVVEEGGYKTMPYQTPRFYDTGEIYGRCPTMDAIPALRSLNIASWAYLKNVEGQSKPIVFAPENIYSRISLEFGAVNPWNKDDGDIKIWTPVGDPRSPLDFVTQKREEIAKIFYNDVFRYLEDRKNMTATEAQLRYEEMIQAVSPVLANLQSEFFSPFIKRVVLEMFENGEIEIPPEYLSKDSKMPNFEVIYVTRLDTKLKGVLNANILNFIRMVGEVCVALANAPMMAAYVDFSKIIEIMAHNSNVSADVLNDKEEIARALKDIDVQKKQQALIGMLDKINLQKTPEKGSAQDQMINGL